MHRYYACHGIITRFMVYCRFQVSYQNAVPKVVLIIPNYFTKFGILRGNFQSQLYKMVNYSSKEST